MLLGNIQEIEREDVCVVYGTLGLNLGKTFAIVPFSLVDLTLVNFFTTPSITTVDNSRKFSGLSGIPWDTFITVFVSSEHFSHVGMQTSSELEYVLYDCLEKKKRDLYILLSPSFSDC